MGTPSRGTLVVVEGLDRAGKSTQCAQLAMSLKGRGHEVLSLRFPDRSTRIGQLIDAYLKGSDEQEDHVIHLLFSANRWEAASRIEAALTAGTTVIVDRYYHSGIVYSAAKLNPTLSLNWARQPDEGLPSPDVCVFLDISAEAQAARGGFGEEKYEKAEMQGRVRELFAEVREKDEAWNVVIIDAGREVDVVAEEVLEVVESIIADVKQAGLPMKTVEPW